MNTYLINYLKRDKLGFPSKELILKEAEKLNLKYKQARKLLKRSLWKQVKWIYLPE